MKNICLNINNTLSILSIPRHLLHYRIFFFRFIHKYYVIPCFLNGHIWKLKSKLCNMQCKTYNVINMFVRIRIEEWHSHGEFGTVLHNGIGNKNEKCLLTESIWFGSLVSFACCSFHFAFASFTVFVQWSERTSYIVLYVLFIQSKKIGCVCIFLSNWFHKSNAKHMHIEWFIKNEESSKKY